MTIPLCSCGCTEAHEVARRYTSNGVAVVLWSDGGVSGAMGMHVWGMPARNPESHALYMRAGWLLMDEVSLYDSREVRALVKAARRAVQQKREAALVYLRRVMAGRPYHICQPAARPYDNSVTSITEYDETTGTLLRHRSVHKAICPCATCRAHRTSLTPLPAPA